MLFELLRKNNVLTRSNDSVKAMHHTYKNVI